VLTGRIGGMSTVFSSTWSFFSRVPYFQQERFTGGRVWRLVYAAGLILGAALWWVGFGPSQALSTGVPAWQLLLGGLLVGYGARLSNGCTSGHGICGLAHAVAVAGGSVIFMATGFATAHLSWR
jgi:uncharacterized membrane protein YedE/YeeE